MAEETKTNTPKTKTHSGGPGNRGGFTGKKAKDFKGSFIKIIKFINRHSHFLSPLQSLARYHTYLFHHQLFAPLFEQSSDTCA